MKKPSVFLVGFTAAYLVVYALAGAFLAHLAWQSSCTDQFLPGLWQALGAWSHWWGWLVVLGFAHVVVGRALAKTSSDLEVMASVLCSLSFAAVIISFIGALFELLGPALASCGRLGGCFDGQWLIVLFILSAWFFYRFAHPRRRAAWPLSQQLSVLWQVAGLQLALSYICHWRVTLTREEYAGIATYLSVSMGLAVFLLSSSLRLFHAQLQGVLRRKPSRR